jgi:hypothetical protein
MKKLSHVAAVVSLGLACAMPVMAQSTGSTTTPSDSTTASSSTMNNSTTPGTTPSTSQMGAGPSDMDRPVERNDGDRDMGWIGLLGLAGLLGLRRKHHDHVDRTGHRATHNVR